MTSAAPGDTAARPTRRPPLLLIYSITCTGILANTMLTPAVPDILDDLGVSDSRAGMLVAAGTLPGIVMAPLIGLLADRYGRRRVLTPCLASFGLFGALSALAPTFEILLLARLLQGIGSAGLINLAVVLIGDYWEGAERTRIVGRNSAVLTSTLAVFPPLGGLLTEIGGWRLAFVPYTIGLVTAFVVWRDLPDRRPDSDGTDEHGSFRGSPRAASGVVIRSPVVLATIITGFVIFVLIFGLFLTAMPVHLRDEFGLGAGARGLVIAAPAIPSTLMALNVSVFRNRLGVRRLLTFAAMAFVVAFVLIGSTELLVVVLLAAALYGLGEGVFHPDAPGRGDDRRATAASGRRRRGLGRRRSSRSDRRATRRLRHLRRDLDRDDLPRWWSHRGRARARPDPRPHPRPRPRLSHGLGGRADPDAAGS